VYTEKHNGGKRKLINAAYILLTAVLIFLFIMPTPGTNVLEEWELYFSSISSGAKKSLLEYQCDTASGACQITGIGRYKENKLTVPQYIGEYRVTSIGDGAFKNQFSITYAEIPSTVAIIGNEAFRSCNNLIEVNVADGTMRIGTNAFAYCNNLRTISLPASLTSIGNYAFHSCTKLSSIKFGGTKAHWLKLSENTRWNANGSHCTVICSDGVL
jgi:hypothetical protein